MFWISWVAIVVIEYSNLVKVKEQGTELVVRVDEFSGVSVTELIGASGMNGCVSRSQRCCMEHWRLNQRNNVMYIAADFLLVPVILVAFLIYC